MLKHENPYLYVQSVYSKEISATVLQCFQLTKKTQDLTMENLPKNGTRRATPTVEMTRIVRIKLEAHHSPMEFCKGSNSSKLFATGFNNRAYLVDVKGKFMQSTYFLQYQSSCLILGILKSKKNNEKWNYISINIRLAVRIFGKWIDHLT
jgi:hypothetical protein